MDSRLIIRSGTIAVNVAIKLSCYELLKKDGGEKLFNREKNLGVELVLRQTHKLTDLVDR